MSIAESVEPSLGAQLSVHVVMGDPLLSRAAEIYRHNLAEAGVEGAEHAVPPSHRPVGRTSFHVVVSPKGEPVGVMRASSERSIRSASVGSSIETSDLRGSSASVR